MELNAKDIALLPEVIRSLVASLSTEQRAAWSAQLDATLIEWRSSNSVAPDKHPAIELAGLVKKLGL